MKLKMKMKTTTKTKTLRSSFHIICFSLPVAADSCSVFLLICNIQYTYIRLRKIERKNSNVYYLKKKPKRGTNSQSSQYHINQRASIVNMYLKVKYMDMERRCGMKYRRGWAADHDENIEMNERMKENDGFSSKMVIKNNSKLLLLLLL